MKRLLSYIAFLVILFACTPKITVNDTTTMYVVDEYITQYQIDSVCNAELINSDLDTWTKTYFIDYETNKSIIEYGYIVGDSINTNVIYKLMIHDIIDTDTIYKYTKIIFNK